MRMLCMSMNAPLYQVHYQVRRQLSALIAREDKHAYGSAPHEMSWHEVHARIVALGQERAAHEHELCRRLLQAERLAVHVRAGYASLREYIERTVGLSGKQTEERLRVGRALTELPLLAEALSSGELCWSAVRELTRVATAETEQSWRDWALGDSALGAGTGRRRSREIEAAVAGRKRGDTPSDRHDPALVRHTLRFDVRADTMAPR